MNDKRGDARQNNLLADAVVQIKKLKSRVRELESAHQEAVAIVGMACVFPAGMNGVEEYWEGLKSGIDAIGEMGNRRWNMNQFYSPNRGDRGRMYTSRAGLIDGIDLFDAEFFGIAPREADNMDPQQRILLQTTWRALESAGIDPAGLLGSDTGVFVGAMNRDYVELQLSLGAIDEIGGYLSSGNISSVLSGRISYQLGLKGPCVSLDTACSSSLTAIHLAVMSLRQGESSIALVGGVNAIVSPATTIAECKANMLSPEGLCKTFDAAADGYVRSEGCGMLVLKRLSQALADGDPIRAVIRGSAVNQDGRSQGLTAPNGPSQQAVIRAALAKARVSPAAVSYVEAHGTGTPLGDPIEVQALDAVYGGERREPLWLGSVKTNIGHAESAAGVAGLIKVALALEHRQIPAHLHLQAVNPHIPLDAQRLRIPRSITPWDAEQRLAGVSSFGFSGTNAHVILEEAPPRERLAAQHPPREPAVLCISAKNPAALAALRERYLTFLQETPEPAIGDLCYTAAVGRSHFPYRLAVTGTTATQLREALSQAELPTAPASSLKVAWLCSGQGSQYAGMGKQLYQQEPVFRAEIDRCADLLADELDLPLTTLLWGEAGDRLDETCYTQPALFAFSYSLAQQWRAWGVEPALLLGHSVGEYVAACLAGVFSLADGLRLIAARGRLMQAQTPAGRMAAVLADVAVVREALADEPATEIAIAAYNGPHNTVVSGAPAAVERVMACLEADGHRVQALAVKRAFHSPLMAPMLAAFRRVAESVTYRAPAVAMVSNVSGQLETRALCEAEYWVRHVQAPVDFAAGMAALSAAGADVYLELGPSHTLVGMGRACGVEARAWLPSLVRGSDAGASLSEAVAGYYAAGGQPDWAAYYAGRGYQRISVPTYPFQGKKHWLKGHTVEAELAPADVVADWFYRVDWQPQAAHAERAVQGRWLVLCDRGGIAAHGVDALGQQGLVADCVMAGGDIDPTQPAAFERLLAERPPYAGIVYAWALDCTANDQLDGERLQADEALSCGGLLHLVQALLQRPAVREASAPLYIVTRGAQGVAADAAVSVSQAPVVGMAKVIATEHPELHSVSVDLAGGSVEAAGEQLGWSLCRSLPGECVALRGESVLLPALARQNLSKQCWQQTPTAMDPNGQYLVVGGAGALGLKAAEWLLKRGAKYLWLSSRTGQSNAETDCLIDTYPDAEIAIIKSDISTPACVREFIAKLQENDRELKGIIHAAGVLDDGTIATQTFARLQKVTRPKTQGLWNLHRLAVELKNELDFFVAFSSIASIVGTAGQVNYVAANAFVDALGFLRNAQHQTFLSINWGAWSEAGMAVSKEARQNLSRNQIFLPIKPDYGIEALEYLLKSQSHRGIVAPVNWENFGDFINVNSLESKRHFLKAFIQEGDVSPDTVLAVEFAKLSAPQLKERLKEKITAIVRDVMGLDENDELDPDRPLQEIGLDSLMALELRNAINRLVSKAHPVSLLFDYPSISKLSSQLATEVSPVDERRESVAGLSGDTDDIAIIGIACNFPGAASDIGKYWRLLEQGECGVEPLENKRWSKTRYFAAEPQTAGKTYLNFAGLLNGVQRFDADFFGLSPIEAKYLDPQQRFLLENSWAAIEDAGYSPKDFAGSRTAVYVGLMAGDYAFLWQQQGHEEMGPYLATGNALSTASGRISYVLGLEGPSLSIDTACSSSLVAVHQGCQAILHGEAEQALVGGVNLLLHPTNSISLSQAGMLSPEGLCKTFDAAADGYVRSEGCGMLVLKRLSRALADGDPIRAVIRGSAVNQDGRSQGLTAPNGPSQQAVIRAALAKARVSPVAVSYVEAHGTGTPLGDPIEVQALDAVYGEDRREPLWLGSVKTNIGHAESAAGVAGLIKVALALEHRQIPAHLHLQAVNPHIPLDAQRLRIPRSTTPWDAEQRLAGVSSFGFSGTNAHVILEEAPPRERPAAQHPPREPAVLCISAKSPAALAALRERYLTFLQETPAFLQETPEPAVGDLCYTAATGRSHFPYRLAVTGTTAVQLHDALSQAELPTAPASPPKVAWLCSGQGSQYAGMGKQLYQQEPVFRAEIDRCADLLADELDLPLTTLLWGEAGDRLDETCYTQPALFAFSYSLAQQWRAWGVEPALLLGHSVGEYVAACLAGVFSLADGLRLIAARGRLMQAQTPAGRMAAVLADVAVVREALADEPATEIAIAAYNGPHNTVVSGAPAAVERVMARLAADGHRVQGLAVKRAFHSPLMAPMLAAFRRVAESVTYCAPAVAMVSNV
ncbi:SDR family oxidoreductase, partial [Exilibacterium tricleocarpae]